MLDLQNRSKDYQKTLIGVSMLMGLFVLLVIMVVAFPDASARENVTVVEEKSSGVFINPFDQLHLEAEAVHVLDVVTGEVLYSRNAEKQLPIASITKLMTALIASETGSGPVVITPEVLAVEGDHGLESGEEWSLRDLIDFTLLTSSNDGAHALASVVASEGTFVQRMNRKAKEIGLVQTFYTNPTGLDYSGSTAGAVGSARDVAKLMEFIIRNNPEIVEATRYEQEAFTTTFGSHEAENTNEQVTQIPGLIASKTGFTDLAGGNLVIAFDPGINRPIIIAVLGSSKEGRFSDVGTLAKASLLYIQSTP